MTWRIKSEAGKLLYKLRRDDGLDAPAEPTG
jgi:hypothetical protein